jgi:site-specific DNA-cytosine methylase
MKYLSLFTGIGGFELGIQQAYESLCNAHRSENGGIKTNQEGDKRQGFLTKEGEDVSTEKRPASECTSNISDERPLCIGYSEIDKYAIQTYQSHFPNHKNYGDITKINEKELPEFDMLCGGFPCQAFSIAGKREGFADTRGTLFFDIARILKEKQPRLLFLENVKGLLSHDSGRTFKVILSTLTELGYDIQWQVLNSKNFGVPQNRERVFIIGHLRGTPRPEVFPIERISGQPTDIQQKTEGQQPRILSDSSCEGRDFTNPKNWRDAQGRPRVRRLTPIECERLQGFPDNWTAGVSDTQRYKQCGNAVTVNVIQAIAEKLLTPHPTQGINRN